MANFTYMGELQGGAEFGYIPKPITNLGLQKKAQNVLSEKMLKIGRKGSLVSADPATRRKAAVNLDRLKYIKQSLATK
jgi:hypothetical protein